MKTTIDIPRDELEEAMRHLNAKTKREAVVVSIRHFNRHRRLKDAARLLGTFKDFVTAEELEEQRRQS